MSCWVLRLFAPRDKSLEAMISETEQFAEHEIEESEKVVEKMAKRHPELFRVQTLLPPMPRDRNAH